MLSSLNWLVNTVIGFGLNALELQVVVTIYLELQVVVTIYLELSRSDWMDLELLLKF